MIAVCAQGCIFKYNSAFLVDILMFCFLFLTLAFCVHRVLDWGRLMVQRTQQVLTFIKILLLFLF